jgi:hypothetical protein
MLGVRISAEDRDFLEQVAIAEEVSVSEWIRKTVHAAI